METANSTGQYSANIQKLLSDIENYGKFEYTGQNNYKDVLDRLLAYGDFSYDKQGQLDAAMQKVLNPESFAYDPTTDPTWSSYKKIYSREGDRAAQNALVQASVATGGVPSSYAVTAAQQTKNNYNGQMADILPTLRQNAYQEYLDNYDKQLTALSVLTGDRDTKYGTWQDAYSKLQSDLATLQADRDTKYGQWSDYLSVLLNALGNYQAQDATDYQKRQDAYGNLLTLITTTGFVPDAATLAAAGMSAEEAAAWKAYYDKANGITASGGGGGYVGGGYTANPGWDEETIREFQNAHGLAADGIWGPLTANAYDADPDWKPEELGEAVLTEAANKFILNHSNAYARGGIDALKQSVEQDLESSGLSDDEKVAVMKHLQLW